MPKMPGTLQLRGAWVGSPERSTFDFGLAPTLVQRKRGQRGCAHEEVPAAVDSLRTRHAGLLRTRESPLDL
jgi:hypothetical protein